MSSWRAYLDHQAVRIVYTPDQPGEEIWAGEVELHRGAPAVDSHPELRHAFLSIDTPELHGDFIRHQWTWSIPDTYEGLPNTGERRRYLMLDAHDAEMCWRLVLKLPTNTPIHVYARICAAFRAQPKENAMPKAAGPDQTPKSATLQKGAVPTADPLPAPAKEGVNSLYGPAT